MARVTFVEEVGAGDGEAVAPFHIGRMNPSDAITPSESDPSLGNQRDSHGEDLKERAV